MAGIVDVAARVWVYWALAKKISGKIIKMQVFLGFERFLFSNSVAVECSSHNTSGVVPHVMAGTIDVAVRVWVYWALAKKISGNLIECTFFLVLSPFCYETVKQSEG